MTGIFRVFLFLGFFFALLSGSSNAQVIYVDLTATGANNGSSWTNAHTTIGAALTAASSGQQIWVADGQYSPAAMLDMKSGVEIYGGFKGISGPQETLLSQRNVTVNLTTINGQIVLDHVVRFNGTTNARLDGFTIKRGHADGGGINNNGGGTICLNANSSNRIANCIYNDNSANDSGGGIYCDNSSVIISNCSFTDNEASSVIGGGIALFNNSGAQIVNCLFLRNDADFNGGGIGCNSSNPSIVHCIFRQHQNDLGTEAGAISCGSNADPLIANCVFSDHDFYGVAELDATSDPAMSYCLFFNNGSGHYLNEGTTPLNTAVAIDALAEASNILVGNPLYVNTATDDYHLQAGSPLTDAGANLTTGLPLAALDSDGIARGFDGDALCSGGTGDGSDFDIGLYEYKSPAPQIEAGALTLNFGSRDIAAGASAPLNEIITNSGDANLTFSSISIIGTNAGDFSLTAAPDTSNLAASLQRTYSVTFDPSATGSRSANLRFNNNDTCSGTLLIALNGTGTVAPDINVVPLSLGFGSRDIAAGPGSAQQVTIQNTGTAGLSFSSIMIGGTNAADFIFQTAPNLTDLAPGTSRTVSLQFDPASTGAKSASLSINSNDPDEGSVSVSLSGTGTATPDIAVAPSSLSFGSRDITAGPGSAQQVTIQNTGTAALTFASIALAGTNPGDFVFATAPDTSNLAPGTSRTVSLQFDPASTGAKIASLSINSNDPDENPVSVSLSGTGTVTPEIVVTPLSLNFGTQEIPAGPTSPQLVTISNTGTGPLSFSPFTFTGPNTPAFVFATAPDTSDLAPGTSRTVSLQFDPGSTGVKTASLNINTNDPDENPVLVSLSGTAVMPPVLDLFEDVTPLINGISSIDLGSTDIGMSALSRDFRVENNGGAGSTLLLDNLTVTPPFTVAEGLSPSLGSGAADTFTIELPSTVDGDFAGTVTFETNISAQNPFTFAVTGSVLPAIDPGPGPGPEAQTGLTTSARFWELLE